MEKRINKYLSEIGYCSRREADRLLESGRIVINDIEAVMGQKILEDDVVQVDGEIVSNKTKLVYLAVNKPLGITSTTDKADKTNIVDFVGYPTRIFHIGRLDKDSDGLIFMTNDGDIVNKILRSGNNHEKEYIVEVDKIVSNNFVKKLESGVEILGTKTKPCKVEKTDHYSFRIILTEGMNRQIRRMCSAYDYKVRKLTRVRIMNVTLEGLDKGKWRYLTNEEVNTIKDLVSDSSKTEEASK
jgi:23S rRNA pseudouridine2604 synthase